MADKLEGAHPADLAKKIQALTSAAASLPPATQASSAAAGGATENGIGSDANLEDR